MPRLRAYLTPDGAIFRPSRYGHDRTFLEGWTVAAPDDPVEDSQAPRLRFRRDELKPLPERT